jgi:hypothetical protein
MAGLHGPPFLLVTVYMRKMVEAAGTFSPDAC